MRKDSLKHGVIKHISAESEGNEFRVLSILMWKKWLKKVYTCQCQNRVFADYAIIQEQPALSFTNKLQGSLQVEFSVIKFLSCKNMTLDVSFKLYKNIIDRQ